MHPGLDEEGVVHKAKALQTDHVEARVYMGTGALQSQTVSVTSTFHSTNRKTYHSRYQFAMCAFGNAWAAQPQNSSYKTVKG